MTRKIIIELIAFAFILLFVYAAGSKLIDLEKFAVVISKSPLLYPFANQLAPAIPALEIVIAILIAIPRYRHLGLMSAFTLMVIFTAYIGAILQLNENIPCACGGVLQSLGWKEHFVFNIAFSSIGILGIVLQAQDRSLSNKTGTNEKNPILQ